MIDVPRVQESSNHIRWLEEANCFHVLLNGAGEITLAIQMIAVLLEYIGQTFLIVFATFRNSHRDIVQILFEQQIQFALQIFLVQMVDGVVGRYHIACAEFYDNGSHCLQQCGIYDEFIHYIDNG